MKVYQLYATQLLPTDLDSAWDFLSNPENLPLLTPGYMNFRIISESTRQMYPGQIITYKVSPFPAMTVKWVSEITHVERGRYFVDEQRYGPYSFWHHKHFIHPVEGGVTMVDIVDYKLPWGILGQWLHSLHVKNKLRSIFAFRAEKVGERFGQAEGKASIQFNSF
jgi:ligand-binding SRPBCC domain-containing protein